MLNQIYHKKNELQEVEFFEDAECTVPFDFTRKKNLYILLKDGDITPLIALDKITPTDRSLGITAYVPYIPNVKIITNNLRIITLDEITPNLSKYIPEDSAVLFLSEEDKEKYNRLFTGSKFRTDTVQSTIKGFQTQNIITAPTLTIFLQHITQETIQKANEVAKELKEKYGVEEVNVFALHFNGYCYDGYPLCFINKIITTNSTGILPNKDEERLQVIDCKEIFEEYLKENN